MSKGRGLLKKEMKLDKNWNKLEIVMNHLEGSNIKEVKVLKLR